MKKLSSLRIAAAFCLFAAAMEADAQFQQQQQPEVRELAPVSTTYAITNAVIVQAPGRKIDRGTIVIRNGLIAAVGANVSIPGDAIIIRGDSLHVYAGFIDGLSRTGVAKPKEETGQNRERPRDPGNPSPEVAGITPQNDVRLTLNPAEKSIEDMRAAGFTVSQVVPYGGMLPGTASIIFLKGKTVDEMILAGRSAMYSELATAQRVYPNTVIGVIAKWRELYRQAMQAKSYENLYAANRTGLTRPASNRILEAFYPVIDRSLPMLFKAEKFLEAQRILSLQKEFGWPLILGDIKEGWDAIPRLKAAGVKPFLSLDLPEDKKFSPDSTKKEKEKKSTKGNDKPDPEKEALEKRKDEAIQLYTSQAAAFQKSGMVFGFSGLTVKSADIHRNLRRMVAAGLTEEQALAALTTSPAQMLGLSDRLGSIDAGKIANLVLSDRPYFNEKARIRYVFVDGTMFRYDPKDKPKPDAKPAVDITGTWTVTTETSEGRVEEKVTFRKEGNVYTGSIAGGRFEQAASLETIELTGARLKYSYTTQAEGQSVKVDVDVTLEGDSFRGSAVSGRFGSFAVEGKKDPMK